MTEPSFIETELIRRFVLAARVKEGVRIATSANVTLSGEQTLQGVDVFANDRVLVGANTDAAENGLFRVRDGAWERAEDADTLGSLPGGTIVPILEGDYAGGLAILRTTEPVTPGVTDQEWAIAPLPVVSGAHTTVAADQYDLTAENDITIKSTGGPVAIGTEDNAESAAVFAGTGASQVRLLCDANAAAVILQEAGNDKVKYRSGDLTLFQDVDLALAEGNVRATSKALGTTGAVTWTVGAQNAHIIATGNVTLTTSGSADGARLSLEFVPGGGPYTLTLSSVVFPSTPASQDQAALTTLCGTATRILVRLVNLRGVLYVVDFTGYSA